MILSERYMASEGEVGVDDANSNLDGEDRSTKDGLADMMQRILHQHIEPSVSLCVSIFMVFHLRTQSIYRACLFLLSGRHL